MSWFNRKKPIAHPRKKMHPHNSSPATTRLFKETQEKVSLPVSDKKVNNTNNTA